MLLIKPKEKPYRKFQPIDLTVIFLGKYGNTFGFLNKPIAAGDLILAEVLQGFRHEKHLNIAIELFETMPIYALAGEAIAVKSANNYRLLRGKGITIRKTIDCLIATYCIEHKLSLLQADKDFEPFHEHLALQRAFSRT